MTKKERVTAAIRGEEVDKIPSGFSLHFPKESAFGDAAVKAHLKFFEESDTDILKIMNENLVPYMGEINNGSDYSMVKEMTMADGFMQDQVELVKKILAGCDETHLSWAHFTVLPHHPSIPWKRWTPTIHTTR